MDLPESEPSEVGEGIDVGDEEARRGGPLSENMETSPSPPPKRDRGDSPNSDGVPPSDMQAYRRSYEWWKDQVGQVSREGSSSQRQRRHQ